MGLREMNGAGVEKGRGQELDLQPEPFRLVPVRRASLSPAMECQACYAKIPGRPPRFGPPKVICGLCGEILETGLTPWSQLSFFRKALAIAEESVAPSFLGKAPFGALVVFLSSCVCCSVAFFVADSKTPYLVWPLCLGAIGLYLAASTVPLLRRILNSRRAEKHGEIPVWRAEG